MFAIGDKDPTTQTACRVAIRDLERQAACLEQSASRLTTWDVASQRAAANAAQYRAEAARLRGLYRTLPEALPSVLVRVGSSGAGAHTANRTETAQVSEVLSECIANVARFEPSNGVAVTIQVVG